MTGEECKGYCETVSTTLSPEYSTLEPTTILYAVITPEPPIAQPIPQGWTVVTTGSTSCKETEEDDLFTPSSEDIRELLTEILLWTSNMGEYPELLTELCPAELVGSIEQLGSAAHEKIQARAIVQVLRWILGEV